MVRLALLLFVLALVLAVVALISCISAERGTVRALPRWAWIIVILLLPLAGPTLYLLGGRPESSGGFVRRIWEQATGSTSATQPRRTVAPDDGPDFLRQLDLKTSSPDGDRLRRWEEELRRLDSADPHGGRLGETRKPGDRKPDGTRGGRADEAREREVQRREDTPPTEN